MGFWFGRKSAPEMQACAYGPPTWLTCGQEEAGFVRSYEAQLAEVYRTNPVGLRAVRLVAEAIGGLTVFSERDEAARLVKSNDLLERIGLRPPPARQCLCSVAGRQQWPPSRIGIAATGTREHRHR